MDTGNTNYVAIDNVLFNQSLTELVRFPPGRSGSFDLPDSVRRIAPTAFESSKELSSIRLNDGLESIGPFAFNECAGIRQIVIPASVTDLADGVFRSAGLTNIVIPANVKNLGAAAFNECRSLESVRFDGAIPSIGKFAFDGCADLFRFEFPTGLQEIDDYAFRGCKTLPNIAIPHGVGRIGESTFQLCLGLKTISIPGTITNIGNYAFVDCRNLETITVSESNSYYVSVDDVLLDKDKTTLIVCPSRKEGVFRVPDTVTRIRSYAFHYCNLLLGIYISTEPPAHSTPLFRGASSIIVYRLPQTAGWIESYAGNGTAIWQPELSASPPINNQIQFNIDWAKDFIVDVEAADNLTNPNWTKVDTVTLTDGTGQFTAPADRLDRYYRLKWE